MEAWHVVSVFHRPFLVLTAVVNLGLIGLTSAAVLTDTTATSLLGIDNAEAASKQTVRFYKVNRQLQADRLRFTNKAAKKPGCHNFIKKTRVHRLVQLGYESCSLYAKKSCLAESIISAVTEKDKTPVTTLTEGKSWFFDIEHRRGTRAKSWYCESAKN